MKAQFRYTFPIAKAEEREDGVYITGLASGPEIDRDGERVTVDAIASFSRQVEMAAEMGDPIPYRDAHAKDGVLRDLGVVTKAWITPDFHLGVEVRLDTDDNPAALSLYKQIKKGKQFGMSVAGHVLDFADEYVAEFGKIVRTFKDVVLEEISNTTRPAWYPSFGSVLSKAIKDTEGSESDSTAGENVEDELQTEQETETPAVDETTEVEAPAEEAVTEAEAADEAAEEEDEAVAEVIANAEVVDETGEADDESDDTTEEPAEEAAAEETEETTDEAEAETEETSEEGAEAPAEDGVVAQMRAALTTFHTNLTEMLTGMGVEMTPVMVTKSVSQDENESTLAKAISDATAPLATQIEDLQKSLTEATARIEELENSPAGDDAPDMVEKHDLTVDEIAKAMENMTPSDRLRMGLRFGMKPSR